MNLPILGQLLVVLCYSYKDVRIFRHCNCTRYIFVCSSALELFRDLSRSILGWSQTAIEMSDLILASKFLAAGLDLSCHIPHVDARCYAEAYKQVGRLASYC